MKLFLAGAFGLSVAVLPVTTIVQKDFAYGYQLATDGKSSIYSLTLTEDIYRGLTRNDIGDIRVFNAKGQSMRHQIVSAMPRTQVQTQEHTVAFFPIYQDSATQTLAQAMRSVTIKTNGDNTEVVVKNTPEKSKTTVPIAYLMNLTNIKNAPHELSLDWDAAQGDFIKQVHIDGGDSLDSWHNLVRGATISNLKYSGKELIQKQIDLPGRRYKYLRISFDVNQGLQLEKVRVKTTESSISQVRLWTSVKDAKPDPDTTMRLSYIYDSKGMYPVNRLRIRWPNDNILVDAQVQSSNSLQGPWDKHYHGSLYALLKNGKKLYSPDISISGDRARYWRLVILDKDKGQLKSPILELGWTPEQLHFVAEGEAPYTIAFGSTRTEANEHDLSGLREQLNGSRTSVANTATLVGSRLSLGDLKVLEAVTVIAPLPWKKWILWAVLIMAVLLMGLLAFRLSKQIQLK